MMKYLWMMLILMADVVSADSVVAARTIRANAIIQDTDVGLKSFQAPDGFVRTTDVIGQEARVVLYAGRPILAGDIGPPAIVARNQIVRLEFSGLGLQIVTEGRALERGAVGDRVRIMNLNSRATLFGQIQADGTIRVTQ